MDVAERDELAALVQEGLDLLEADVS